MPATQLRQRSHLRRQHLLCLIVAMTMTGCSSQIEPMGKVGSNNVYAITKNTFLSSSQMLVLVNKKGDVTAYSGGTSSGAGTVALETTATLATAGAIAYTGRAIEHGLETARVSGIPSKFKLNADVDTNSNIHVGK